MFIWTVKHVPTLHTSTFIFLASLALTDLFVLLGIGLDHVLDYVTSPTRYGDNFVVSKVYFFLTGFCFVSSLFFVMLVSVERYIAICHPIKHHLLKGTDGLSNLYVACSQEALSFRVGYCHHLLLKLWLYASYGRSITNSQTVIPHLVKLLPYNYVVPGGDIIQIILIVAVVSFVLALAANFYLYIRIIHTLRKIKCNRPLKTSERNICQASIMVIANGTIFYLSWIVFLVQMSIQIIVSFEWEIINRYQEVILMDVNCTFILINASINPLVYFITNKSYRRALKKVCVDVH